MIPKVLKCKIRKNKIYKVFRHDALTNKKERGIKNKSGIKIVESGELLAN